MAGRAQRAVVDQAAAVLILQAALDLEKSSGLPPGELVGGRKPRTPRTPRTKAGGSQR
jgi:putative Holliday junction resolvase